MNNSLLLLLGTILITLPIHSEAAPYAIATRDIHLNGYNLSVDSFNSTDPLRSTGAQYDPLKGGGDGAVMASEAGIHNANNAGTVELLGRLETGLPFALQISAESSIGSIAWHQSGQTGIEPGFHTTNLVLVFPDVAPPFAGFVPVSGTYDGVFYNYILNTGDYNLPSLTMSGGQKMLVLGSASLTVSGNANLSGNSSILILPSAGLRLYVGGTANLRGSGVINQGAPHNFQYFGTGANPTLNLRVTTPFVGMIYAPNAVCSISSGGNTTADLQGAIIARTIVLGTRVDFHFDEGL
jgi:hypothetical protein